MDQHLKDSLRLARSWQPPMLTEEEMRHTHALLNTVSIRVIPFKRRPRQGRLKQLRNIFTTFITCVTTRNRKTPHV